MITSSARFRKNVSRQIGIMLIFGLMLEGAAGPVQASAPALTSAQRTAFERTAAAEAPAGGKLKRLAGEYETLRALNAERDRQIAEAHRRNRDDLSRLRKKAAQIDADRLALRKKEAGQTRAKYRKLLETYRSVYAQLELARKLKSKSLAALWKAQADGLKLPVQLARLEIKAQDAAYASAKKEAQAKQKKVRALLSSAESVQASAKPAKRALTATDRSRRSAWSAYTQALRRRDAKAASDLLASVNELTRQIADRQKKIHSLEIRASDILRSAEAQLA